MFAVRGLSLVWALGILALSGAQAQDLDHRGSLRGLKEQQQPVQEAADQQPADNEQPSVAEEQQQPVQEAADQQPADNEQPSVAEEQQQPVQEAADQQPADNEQPSVAEDPAVAEEQLQPLQLEKAMKDREHQLALSTAVWLVVQTILVTIVGLLYTSCFQSKPSPDEVLQPERAQEGFRYGLFDGCCHSLRICCCSFWCLPVRWADTASSPQIKFLGFGTAVFLFQFLYVLSRLPSVFISFMAPSEPSEPSPVGAMILLLALAVLFHVLLLVMVVRHRQRVRSQYGLPHGTCCTCTCDVLVWIFCSCCAGMQEALQVEYVGEPVEISEGKFESKRSTMC